MRKWLRSLNIYHYSVVLATIFSIILLISTIWLIPLGWSELTLGYLLGFVVAVISYTITGFLDKNNPNRGAGPLIIMNIVRFILIGGAMFLAGFLYYHENIKLFNIFAVMVGYLVLTIFLIIVTIKRKDK